MFWYLFLAAISIFVVIYAIIKTKNKTLIVLYFFLAGTAFIFEVIFQTVLNCYTYHPGILKEPFADNILGAVVSNLMIVPAIAILITGLRLNFFWHIIFVTWLFFVENLFSELRIYELHWWRTYYTPVAVILFFIYSKTWFKWLEGTKNRFVYFLTLYLSSCSMTAMVQFIMSTAGLYYFRIGLTESSQRESSVLRIIFSYLIVLFPVLAFYLKQRWQTKLFAITGLYIFEVLLLLLGIIKTHNVWGFLIYSSVTNIAGLTVVYLMKRLLDARALHKAELNPQC